MVGVLAALFVAPTASAQEIVILTKDNNTASNTIVGDRGGRFHEYWFDYMTPGAFVEATAEAGNEAAWWAAAGRRKGQVDKTGFGVEVWSPNGLLDDGELRARSAARSAPDGRIGSGCQEAPGNRCWAWDQPGADVLTPTTGRFLMKVRNYNNVVFPYTAEVEGLDVTQVVMGAGPGGEGPLIRSNRAYSGRLAGGERAYYSFNHRGGTGRNHDTDIDVTIVPNLLNVSQANATGVNVYRGTSLLRTQRGGESVQGGLTEEVVGTARTLGIEFRSPNPQLLTIEVFNNNPPGTTIEFALHAE